MNFSGISNRSVIGRLLRAPLHLIPDSAVVPIIQGQLRGKHWIVGSSDHGCWLGSYEFAKQQLFARHIKPGDTVYDIGAHVGFYTLLSAHLVGAKGQVVAFEPFPANAAYLKRHVELNHLTNVRFFENAVSDRQAQVTFAIGGSSSTGRIQPESTSDNTLTVESVALDELIDAGQLPVPDVMKIDVEGEEFRVLRGASKLIANHPVKLFVATHGDAVHQQCLAFLREHGYSITSLNEHPVETTDEFLAVKPS